MSMSPAGFESVPKVGSPEEEVRFGQEAAKEEAAGGDGALKPKEEEAGGDGALKPREEAAGGDGAVANGTAKLPKPKEEAAANGAIKRPKHEEEAAATGATKRPKLEEAAAVGGGLNPEKAAAGGGGPNTEEAAAGDGPEEDFEEDSDEELDLTLMYLRLLRGEKMKKSGKIKKVRVEGKAIESMLQVRPRDMTMPEDPPLPEDFHLLPEDIRTAHLRRCARAKDMFEFEQNVIDQYDKKGYAVVHSYVVE